MLEWEYGVLLVWENHTSIRYLYYSNLKFSLFILNTTYLMNWAQQNNLYMQNFCWKESDKGYYFNQYRHGNICFCSFKSLIHKKTNIWHPCVVFYGYEHFCLDITYEYYHLKWLFLILGESGLGKSTLINSLFLTDLYSADYQGPSHRIQKTVKVGTPPWSKLPLYHCPGYLYTTLHATGIPLSKLHLYYCLNY